MTAWAFVVGINEYPAASKLKPLNGAVADAAEFAEWALHPQGGNVSPQHLFFWTYPAPTDPPPLLAAFLANPNAWPQTKPDLTRAPGMQDICLGVYLVAELALKEQASRLYVYFAGHGFQTKQKSFGEAAQTCFVAGDYDARIAATGLVPCDDMARMLKTAGPPEIAIFIDACRSDASIRVAKPSSPWNEFSDPGHHLRLCTGRAAQEQKVAYEVPLESPSRGAFSTLLINGLRTHRVNGRLTVRDIESYVGDGIGLLVNPYEQYPDFEERPKPWAMVLAQGPPVVPLPDLVLSIESGFAGDLVLIGGPNQARVTLPGSAGTHRLSLAQGAYFIETADGRELCGFSHFGPGETHVKL